MYNKFQDDNRQQILLSTFGFLHGGTMYINVTDFTYDKIALGKNTMVRKKNTICLTYLFAFCLQFGFSIDKAKNSGIADYLVMIKDF